MPTTVRHSPEEVDRFTGDPVNADSVQTMAYKVLACFQSVYRQAALTTRIPHTNGIWLEQVAYFAIDRSLENQNRSSGDIYTIIDGQRRLAMLVPDPRTEQLFGRFAVVAYQENAGQPDEYGFEVSFSESGRVSSRRLAAGEPIMSRIVTDQAVHEEVVQRAIAMQEEFTTPEGEAAAQKIRQAGRPE